MKRSLRVTTLNDKSDAGVRYDLFERLNTGGVRLHAQEIRNCVMQGRFRDLLASLVEDANYHKVVRLSHSEQETANYEECVLRFFAFSERYEVFEHNVGDFLNEYMLFRADTGPSAELISRFEKVMAITAKALPKGVVRGTRNLTPINLYEAVTVGLGLALKSKQAIKPDRLPSIINSKELRDFTTAGTNNRKMVAGRIEFVRNELLA